LHENEEKGKEGKRRENKKKKRKGENKIKSE
jgi:hypothetical protein